MVFDLSYIIAGALTGLVVGLTGVGGGALMTPILLLFFGIAPNVAVGTDLWFAALTKSAAVRLHHTRGMINWRIARLLWTGSLPAAAITLGILAFRPDIFGNVKLLKQLIGFAIFLTAFGLVFQSVLTAYIARKFPERRPLDPRIESALTIAGGSILGFLVTLTSVGAGALGTVFLAALYPKKLDPRQLIATDIAHAIPLALVAGAGHLASGHFDIRLLANLLTGSIPAILIGSWLALRVPHRVLRYAIAAILSIVALRLV